MSDTGIDEGRPCILGRPSVFLGAVAYPGGRTYNTRGRLIASEYSSDGNDDLDEDLDEAQSPAPRS